MKYFVALALGLTTLYGCTWDEILAELTPTQEDATPADSTLASFLPMHVGNRWEVNEQNYTEIQDTLRINEELFYYFFALVGGDMVVRQYLRIDEEDRLIERFPDDPDFRYLHADFRAAVGDTFSTIGDDSRNNFIVAVTIKTDSTMTFNYQNKQDDYVRFQRTFVRGLGYQEDYQVVELY